MGSSVPETDRHGRQWLWRPYGSANEPYTAREELLNLREFSSDCPGVTRDSELVRCSPASGTLLAWTAFPEAALFLIRAYVSRFSPSQVFVVHWFPGAWDVSKFPEPS